MGRSADAGLSSSGTRGTFEPSAGSGRQKGRVGKLPEFRSDPMSTRIVGTGIFDSRSVGTRFVNTRAVAWLAIVLTALALVPAGAHLFELPSKMKLADESYFMVQNIYRGWAWFGVVLVAALVANSLWAYRSRGKGELFALTAIAALCLAATLAIFFVWIYPANQQTRNWTVMTDAWSRLRLQWEAAHAASAVITFIALCCLARAALIRSE
jgi:hypothetical protein